MKFESKHIVVDADIARASGLSEHPLSSNARKVLQAVLDSEISVAFCPALLAEWRAHRSVFSAKWQSTMIARKRFSLLTPKSLAMQEITRAQISDAQRDIAAKDAHIIDIALGTGKFIASNDCKARFVFCQIAKNAAILDEISWVSAEAAVDDLANLIQNGGYIPEDWLLRSGRVAA